MGRTEGGKNGKRRSILAGASSADRGGDFFGAHLWWGRQARGVGYRSGTGTLIEVLFRNGLGLCGIELGALIEVVGEGFLDDLFCLPTVGPHGSHGELGLGRSSGGMDEGGEVGSPMWARIWVMGLGSVRNVMKVSGVWQVGQISGNTS